VTRVAPGPAIEPLDLIEAVRQRPAMYLGGVDPRALHHLVLETIDNVVDQHLVRDATELEVEVADDGWITVRDDGPGLGLEREPRGKSALELVLSTLTRTPRAMADVRTVGRDGRPGLGLGVVNALSARLELEATRGGDRWAQAYERGRPIGDLQRLGTATRDGTELRFRPDPEIFGDARPDAARLASHLQHLAWLAPLLRLSFQGRRLDGRGGLAGLVQSLAGGRRDQPRPGYATQQHVGHVMVDLALAWSEDPAPTVRTFANFHESPGATHVDGLWQGLVSWASALGVPEADAAERAHAAFGPGLVAVIHLATSAPRAPAYASPWHDHVTAPRAAAAVRQALHDATNDAFTHGHPLREFLSERLTR
jgi:DNA gyrase/topoisomerase IV subunit B